MSKQLELAKSVVEKASAGGAEVEVIITSDQSTEIQIKAGEVDLLTQSGSQGMGVRVIKDGQTGYAYTSDFSDESIDQTWRTALELSEVATADEHRKIPEPQAIPDEDLGIWDPNFADVSVEQKIEKAKQLEKAALDYDSRVILTQSCTYGDSISMVHLANSKGFADEYGRTTAYGFLFGIARDETGDTTTGLGFTASNFFDQLDTRVAGRDAGEKAVMLLGGKPVETQTASVVLDQYVGAQILMAMAQALSAESWQKHRSFLVDKLGQTVGNDMVTIMDNGRLEGGLASAPFDGEGVPTSATRLIDEGVLQNLMYDSYTASQDGVMSTGNAQRDGHRSTPTLGASNFYFRPGNKTRGEIIAGVENGLLVLNAMQTGGIDPINGDCSMSASGLWIKDGEIVGPVNQVTIATTLGDFLMNVTDVGNDMQVLPFMGAIGVPTLRVDNVTIGGSN